MFLCNTESASSERSSTFIGELPIVCPTTLVATNRADAIKSICGITPSNDQENRPPVKR